MLTDSFVGVLLSAANKCALGAGAYPVFMERGGSIDQLWYAKHCARSAPCRGSGGMLPQKILEF